MGDDKTGRRMRPADDPEQTDWHIGARWLWLWIMPLIVVGTPFLLWDIYQDIVSGEDVRARSYALFVMYPALVGIWLYMVVRFVRARRRGETPKLLSWKPTPFED